MKDIYIEIAGTAGVGKTTIAHKIGRILKSHGMNVTVLDDQYDDSKVTDEAIERNLGAIGKKGRVIIRSKQLQRTVI